MNAPDIFERLRADHRRVLDALDALEHARAEGATPGSDTGHALVRMLEHQFSTHVISEETLLFPALARALPAAEANLAQLGAEHEELRSLLALLGTDRVKGAPADEQAAIQLRDLGDLLRIHIRKEEAAVFRVAERLLSPEDIAAMTRGMVDEPETRVADPATGTTRGTP